MADVVTMDKIVSLARRRGFVFPSSEIYGGLGSAYDYGHYGVLLKENVKARWLEAMVRERDDIVALDSSIILHPAVWEASGHVSGFVDPLVDCRTCKLRFRADHLNDPEHEEVRCGRKPSKRPGEFEDCDLTELLTADYSFLNERLAAYYDVSGVKGEEMRRVMLPGGRRFGVLTHASVLIATSNPNRTSPVKRGLFVLENLLGREVPPPPPAVGNLEDARDAEPIRREAPPERTRSHELRGKGAVERGGRALARYVADGHDQRVRLGREEIVEIAAELARRLEPAGDVDPAQGFRHIRGQQRRLDALRETKLLLDALLVARDLLV